MPVPILRPAYFKPCEKCGQHGRIIFSDGSSSDDILTATEARNEIKRALAGKKMLDTEVERLIKQIYDSLIPPAVLDGIILFSTLTRLLADEGTERIPKTQEVRKTNLN